MVTFISLFLGLITGSHMVELAIDGPAARVEIVLDQKIVRIFTRPPWRGVCDFGDELRPHELVAIAYDADGVELGRARQLVNLPRPFAESRIAFESDDTGRPIAVRVYWESSDAFQPLSVFAIFDGLVLQQDDDGRYPLPPYDLNEVHIVSAEVRFLDGITARSDATFGGRYGSQVSTELTAIPIRFDDKPPELAQLKGKIFERGRRLEPVAVERTGARVLLVRDQAAVAQMTKIRRRQDAYSGYRHVPEPGQGAEEVPRKQDRLHFVVANPIRRLDRQLYPTTSGFSLKRWNIRWLATHLFHRDASVAGQRITDAVAVAGVNAAAEGVPRAVVLLLSDNPNDRSRFTQERVRGFLRELRVPLFVWHTGSSPPAGWEPAWGIENARDLKLAEKAVRRELSKQCVVWVDGDHMVNQVELSEDVAGFRLAGQ